jgi:ABC-type antimicrobial peptide transport system permease subunit
VDVPGERSEEVEAYLEKSLSDLGLELTSTERRLEAFGAVQNTYLEIFLILGGLGMMLGSVGLGVLVYRNSLERRSEFALLRALGFSVSRLKRMILWEHGLLAGSGLLIGTVSALVAVFPALAAPGTRVPLETLAVMFIGIAAASFIWIWIATRAAFRKEIIQALRDE